MTIVLVAAFMLSFQALSDPDGSSRASAPLCPWLHPS